MPLTPLPRIQGVYIRLAAGGRIHTAHGGAGITDCGLHIADGAAGMQRAADGRLEGICRRCAGRHHPLAEWLGMFESAPTRFAVDVELRYRNLLRFFTARSVFRVVVDARDAARAADAGTAAVRAWFGRAHPHCEIRGVRLAHPPRPTRDPADGRIEDL